MPANDPLIALLYRLNQNQNAIGAAVEELAVWVEQRGSTDTGSQVRRHLDVLLGNADFIAEALEELIAKSPTD